MSQRVSRPVIMTDKIPLRSKGCFVQGVPDIAMTMQNFTWALIPFKIIMSPVKSPLPPCQLSTATQPVSNFEELVITFTVFLPLLTYEQTLPSNQPWTGTANAPAVVIKIPPRSLSDGVRPASVLNRVNSALVR